MRSFDEERALRPSPDALLTALARYAHETLIDSEAAYETARYCLMAALACGFEALKVPACVRLLGPIVPGAVMAGGARVPGTSYELDPVQAAFSIGAMIRWVDGNDTGIGAGSGDLSDNVGGILSVADYLSRKAMMEGRKPLMVRDLLTGMIKAYEIQGALAQDNPLDQVGLDHVLLVRIATSAVATAMLGGTLEQVANALSNAWIDGGALRTYRHAPNTGSRQSWAGADATARGVRHAFLAIRGEMGYPSALSARTWGFCDVLFKGKPLTLGRELGSAVMQNVAFPTKPNPQGAACATRAQSAALLVKKFETAVAAHYGPRQSARILKMFAPPAAMDLLTVNELMAALVCN